MSEPRTWTYTPPDPDDPDADHEATLRPYTIEYGHAERVQGPDGRGGFVWICGPECAAHAGEHWRRGPE